MMDNSLVLGEDLQHLPAHIERSEFPQEVESAAAVTNLQKLCLTIQVV